MNGLYGYPSPAHVGMGSLNPDQQQAAEVTVTGVINGSVYRDIKNMQSDQRKWNGKVASMKVQLDRLDDSEKKRQALAAWQKLNTINKQQDQRLRQAVDKYNQVARLVRQVSLNFIQPKMLAGLGAVGAAGIALAAIIAAPFICWGLAEIITSLKAGAGQREGAMQSAARIFESIPKTFEEGAKLTKGLTTLIVVGVVGYFAYQIYEEYTEGGGSLWGDSGGGRPIQPRQTYETVSSTPRDLKFVGSDRSE